MVVGTTLLKLDGTAYYSPSFPRGGLAAVFAANVTQFQGLSAFAIDVEHRDENEVNFVSAGVFTSITAVGVKTKELGDLKQILRFKYTLTGSNAYDGIHFIMQAPTWRPYD